MISELISGCRSLKLDLKPQRIIIDFEQGAISAFQYFFPRSTVIGCFFHFGQYLFRALVSVGLKEAYGKDETLQSWFKWCVALAFIPKRHIQDIFADKILDEAPIEIYPALNEFCDYMLKTWIDDDALFSSSLWSHHTNTDERVNNNNEGYNHRFYTRTGNVPHPNVWKLIEVFQKEEFLCVQFRTESLLIGTVTSKGTSKRDLEKDNKILKAKNKYLRSGKTFEDRVILLEECTCVVQNFLE
jgi:hypothetical protein